MTLVLASSGWLIFLFILIPLLIILILLSVHIVPQSYAYVIERMGSFKCVWDAGIHFKIPFIDRVAQKVLLKEQVFDFKPQPVITRDNVTMQIDTVVFVQITDPKLYTYGVSNPVMAIENLTATTLRNIIGELELDETLTSREVINAKMRQILDEATDPWGIKVTRVEVKNINPPRDILDAMEKQMRAERERRATILTADGQREAAIKLAEGEKQARILQAEAEKQAQIKKAEGEAEAILKVNEALAEGLKLLNEANPTDRILTLKAYEALMKVADGKATKIIIPSEIQNLAGLVTSIKELVTDAKSEEEKEN